MLTKIKRKLQANKKANHIFLFGLIFLICFISLGYSIMNQYYMVSGDIEYIAQTCMIEDSWKTIISDVQEGELSKYQVGCRKSIEMDINNDGANETYTLRVANNTIPSVCSSSTYSQTACGFVLEFVDIVTSRAMGEEGWETSTARTYINGTVYNALPSGLKKGIIYTTVVSGIGGSNVTTTDRLYLLTHVEVAGSNHDSDPVKTTNTRKLDYYSSTGVTSSNYAGAIKKLNGTATANYMYFSGSKGSPYNGSGTSSLGLSPAFRLG